MKNTTDDARSNKFRPGTNTDLVFPWGNDQLNRNSHILGM